MHRICREKTMKVAALFSLFLAACISHEVATTAAAYEDVLIKDVPHVKQKPDFCGEACAEMYLRKLGHKMDQDYVFNRSELYPLHARGCHTRELARALKSIGFKTGDVWHTVEADNPAQMTAQWQALHADLLKSVPSIVCMHYNDQPRTTEHFRLILGYDAATDEVIYHDPAEKAGAYLRMKKARFLELWPLKYDRKSWTIIRLRLEPGKIEEPRSADGFAPADFAQHMMRLNKKIPGKDFTVVLAPPFVVIGDEKPSAVRAWARRTVKWSVDHLKKDFFAKDPLQILDVWLFKDKKSYRKHTKEIFNDNPSTPFGYYSREHAALIMNIGTGGGTLVHEIVHPFMRSNFPACPAWLNEGMGSLYEQASEKDGHIIGLTNWRLAGLQEAIKAGRVPPFKELTSMSDHQFYNRDNGTNYGQSRYLCYYLQQKGLLIKFYHAFHTNRKDDPTGFGTLKKVLGEKDMKAFKKKWEAFVLKLTFP